jgi:putative glutamine amidotransferase
MTKPWIGIPTRFYDKTDSIGQNRHYIDAIIGSGGLPLFIPIAAPPMALEYVKLVDGILLPGSSTDVDPAHYAATPHPKLGKGSPERDATDFALLKYGENAGLPILGICFGVQSLNVFRGGKLVQDIPSVVSGAAVHDNSENPARHLVQLDEHSLLARLAGASAADVNSYHHQSIEQPGRGLRVVATAPDGVIEGVEDTSGRFIVGVQWHPERDWSTDAFARALFTAFIEEARKSKSGVHPV